MNILHDSKSPADASASLIAVTVTRFIDTQITTSQTTLRSPYSERPQPKPKPPAPLRTVNHESHQAVRRPLK